MKMNLKDRLIESYHIIQSIQPSAQYQEGTSADLILSEVRTFGNLVFTFDDKAGQTILDFVDDYENKFIQLLDSKHPEKQSGDMITKRAIRDDFITESTELLKNDICLMLRSMINQYRLL